MQEILLTMVLKCRESWKLVIILCMNRLAAGLKYGGLLLMMRMIMKRMVKKTAFIKYEDLFKGIYFFISMGYLFYLFSSGIFY